MPALPVEPVHPGEDPAAGMVRGDNQQDRPVGGARLGGLHRRRRYRFRDQGGPDMLRRDKTNTRVIVLGDDQPSGNCSHQSLPNTQRCQMKSKDPSETRDAHNLIVWATSSPGPIGSTPLPPIATRKLNLLSNQKIPRSSEVPIHRMIVSSTTSWRNSMV